MSDETDDLLNELISGKPQPKAEVSAFKAEMKPAEPLKRTKDLEYKKVVEECVCAACHTDLNPGEKHWVFDDWITQTWWCVTCGWEHCNLTPPEE